MRSELALGFDTSGPHCTAALVWPGGALNLHEEMARGQAERLMPMLAELLGEAGADWPDIGVLAVGCGPGNFTGVRIAVSAARGLALGLDVPAVGVSLFEARAFGLPRPLRVIDETRGGMVQGQDFPAAGPAGAPWLAAAEKVGAFGGNVTGSAAAGGLAPALPLAEAIARIGLSRAHAGGDGRLPRPAPLYLRPADAEPRREPGPLILDV